MRLVNQNKRSIARAKLKLLFTPYQQLTMRSNRQRWSDMWLFSSDYKIGEI